MSCVEIMFICRDSARQREPELPEQKDLGSSKP